MTIAPILDCFRRQALQWFAERGKIETGDDNFTPPEAVFPWRGAAALDDDGEPVMVMTLFVDAAARIAVPGWTVSRPGIAPDAAADAFDLLLDNIISQAKEYGCAVMMTMWGRPSLNRQLRRYPDFVFGEKADVYIKKLT